MRNMLVRFVILLAVAAIAGTGYYLTKHLREQRRQDQFPVIQVKRGDLVVRSYVRGELRAVRSTTLGAPNLGASAQVTQLATTGALAKAKDLIVEFDDSELLATLEDAQLEVAQADEKIKKAEADLKIRRNQDQVDLLKAGYAVRRAELEVRRNELVSKIDARKNELTLEEAKRALAKLEEDLKSRLLQGEAEIAVLREQRRKATLDVNRAQMRIAQTRLLTPMSGLVSVMSNRSGMFMFGQQSPDIREGDQVSPGTPLAQILDLSELEVAARVNEIERANLNEGQEVLVRLDALPGKVVHGKVKALSGTASSAVFSADPAKRFDCTLAVNMKELLAHVGAKPEQIESILAAAKENAKTFQASPTAPLSVMLASLGGMSAGPGGSSAEMGTAPAASHGASSPGMGELGGPGAAGRAPSGPGGPRGPAGEHGVLMGGPGETPSSEPDRQRRRNMLERALGGRDIQKTSPEERQKLFAQLREKMGEASPGSRHGSRGGSPSGPAGAPPEPGAPPPGSAPAAAPAAIQLAPGGASPAEGAGPGADPDLLSLSLRQAGAQQFTAEERKKAELPPPPEENSVMDVLLRPGLLVEAEIIVEKVPNTIYVPQQGVFEKGGKSMVYVRAGDRFEPRIVKLGKRTESQVAVVEGLRVGEWISLADPEAGRTPSKKEKGPASSQQPAVPKTGGPPGGGRGGPN